MDNIKNKIKKLSSEYFSEIVEIRRHIHSNPELALKEYETSDYIVSKLKEYNIPYIQGIAKTGITALIKGKRNSSSNADKKTVVLRADMDALPIEEKNDVEYKSKNAGIMHACGHDVHTASLLGTAKILNNLRNDFQGTVKLIFQPSEEEFPGGALMMLKQGVFENIKVHKVFGQHVYPELEAGKIGIKKGKYMASTDEIYITVKGKEGHAAMPEQNIDPVLIAAHIIIALQQIVTKYSKPYVPTVLSFGRFIAQGKTNITPDKVKLEGTFRTFDEKWRNKAHKKIIKMAKKIAESMDGKCEVCISRGYPCLINDEKTSAHVKKYAEKYLGKQNVVDLDLQMIAEDFAYYAQLAPACFYRLGIGNKAKNITSNLHTSTFNVDEISLKTGMGLMAWITVNALQENN